METFLWSIVVLCAVTALSFWYIYPEKPWFVLLLCVLVAAAWWLHAATYLLYLLPLGMAAAAYFYLRPDKSAEEQAPGSRIAPVLYGIGALLPLFWFAFALQGMPDALKLRPADSPAPEATMAEVLADLKLHPEGWLIYGPVLLLSAYAVLRPLIKRSVRR